MGIAVGAFAMVVLAVSLGGVASGAGGPVVPDSSCATESSFKSTAGDTTASLLIINNTGETLQSLWLDYNGKRVFYQQIAPFTSYVQSTFLTHPWVIANLQGACYRFVVMNSVAQTVTVDPGGGATASTASPATGPPASGPAPSVQGNGSGAASGSDSGSSFPALPVVGGVVVVAAAAAIAVRVIKRPS